MSNLWFHTLRFAGSAIPLPRPTLEQRMIDKNIFSGIRIFFFRGSAARVWWRGWYDDDCVMPLTGFHYPTRAARFCYLLSYPVPSWLLICVSLLAVAFNDVAGGGVWVTSSSFATTHWTDSTRWLTDNKKQKIIRNHAMIWYLSSNYQHIKLN